MSTEPHVNVAEGAQELARLRGDIDILTVDSSEANTRFIIINRLIVDCLGWSPATIKLEVHEEGEYSDYELGKPRQAIWEAKRVGAIFNFPATSTKRLVRDLRSILLTCVVARRTVEQLQGYCARRGVEVAVATNGRQFIAFLATRNDGVSPFDGKCLVVDGLDDMQEKFAHVWQALSPQGVAQNRLKQLLKAGTEPRLPTKIASNILGYPRFKAPTKAQVDLQVLAQLLLVNVPSWTEHERDFYATCYCKDWQLSKYSLLARQFVGSRYAALFPEQEAAPSVIPIKGRSLRRIADEDVLGEALSQRPIIILGDVGVGKTAFLKNLTLVEGTSEFATGICLYLDLGAQGALTSDLRKFVLIEIERQLREEYGIDIHENEFVLALYDADLQRFKESVFGTLRDANPQLFEQRRINFLTTALDDRDSHLQAALRRISETTRKQIVVILDNADQRTTEVQIETFAIAQELAKDWTAMAFLAMRTETYLHLRRMARIPKDSQRVFTVSPPNVCRVIRLRTEFAISIADGSRMIPRLEGFGFSLTSFASIARGVLRGLDGLGEFLENYYQGNVWSAVQGVVSFFGNPNVNDRRIVEIDARGLNAVVSLADYWASVLLGKYFYYSPTTSGAANVFDVLTPNAAEHFLMPMLLGYLREASGDPKEGDFVSGSRIVSEFQDWGFAVAAAERAIERASSEEFGLIQRSASTLSNPTSLGSFRLTTRGMYYVLRWIGEFSYLDAVWCDTPIFDSAINESLSALGSELDLESRYRRAIAFRSYLSEVWQSANLQPSYFSWEAHVISGQSSFDSLRGFLESRH